MTTYTGPDIVAIPDGTRCRVTLDGAIVAVPGEYASEGILHTRPTGAVWVGETAIAVRVRGALYPVSNLTKIEVL